MAVTREQVMAALTNRLSIPAFVTVSRRNRGPEALMGSATPALMIVGTKEFFMRASESLPAHVTLHIAAIVYIDVSADDNAIPDAALNPLLDAISAALKPDSPMTGRCTLGGLVQSAMIDGEIEKAPGDVSGRALAVIPIKISMMQTV